MTTRLDRLLSLLDGGSVPVRTAAATQIGEVTKYHQQELPAVLLKVAVLLRSKSWETRTAAGQAIAAIAKNVPTYEPEKDKQIEPVKLESEDVKSEAGPLIETQEDVDDFLRLDTFDILSVQNYGQPLMAKAYAPTVYLFT